MEHKEIEEGNIEVLEAAADIYDDLIAGNHYKKQEESGFTIKYIGKEEGK